MESSQSEFYCSNLKTTFNSKDFEYSIKVFLKPEPRRQLHNFYKVSVKDIFYGFKWKTVPGISSCRVSCLTYNVCRRLDLN